MLRAVAAAGLAGVVTAAAAHPHGSLDCAVRLGVEQGRLAWVEQQLILDAASSQGLMGRLQIDAAEPDTQARLFRQVIAGMFRHSDWMLELKAAEAGTEAASGTVTGAGTDVAAALALDDVDKVRWHRHADGRVIVQARLVPKADGAPWPANGLSITCRDPGWYWVAGFRQAAQVTVDGPRCQVLAGTAQAASEQARALRAAARQAGAANADQVASGLLDGAERRIATVHVNC